MKMSGKRLITGPPKKMQSHGWMVVRVLKQCKTVPRILIPNVVRLKTKTIYSRALRRDIHRGHKSIIPGSASSS